MWAFITINSPLRTAFPASLKFWYVVFHFCCFKYFWFLSDFFLWLFRSMLFSFHIFLWIFQFSSSLMITSFIALWLEKNTWYFNLLTFVKICFVTYHTMYSEECSVYAQEECIFCYCWMECSIISVKSFGLKCSSRPVSP